MRKTYSILLLLLVLLMPAQAQAHTGHLSQTQTFTQDVGPYEVAITIEMPSAVPSPLYLNIAPPANIGAAQLVFRAVPRGFPLDGAPEARVDTLPGPQGIYYTQLDVDRAGEWELDVQVSGAEGSGQARIPFVIVIPPLPAYTIPLIASLGGLIGLMLTSVLLAAATHGKTKGIPAWLDRLIGYGIFICLVSAVIFGVQQISANLQGSQADPNAVVAGRPHANMTLQTEPATANAGQPVRLTFDLSDGSTGLPIDDLVTHHDALMHLIVVDETGTFFAHVHPASSAPGRYSTTVTPDRPGRYTAYAEIVRLDSGTQVLERDFEVGGASVPAAGAAPGLGKRQIGDLEIDVSSSIQPLKAGRQATITLSVSSGGAPVIDIKPWLGMAGHLIARSAGGEILGHIHAVGPMPATTAVGPLPSYGPDIRFVYTFPLPGRYHLWGQFQHNGAIVTVPITVDVE